MERRSLRVALGIGLVCVACLAPGAVPAPWTDTDINAPSAAGTATYDPAADQWVVTGGGSDIWGTSDQFNYTYLPFPVPPGDGIITAKVASLVGNGGTIDGWSKAGVMWRESTAAGSTYAFMCTTPGNGNDFQYRTATGGGAANKGENGSGAMEMWVQCQKQGTAYSGSISSNGTTWTQFGTTTITTTANPLAGLAVCAHNSGGTDSTSATGTFTNVTVTDLGGLYCWPLTPPTLAATVSGYNGIGLSWTDASLSPITSYTVSRSMTSGGPYTVIASGVTGTAYQDGTASYPNRYFYVVQAVGSLGTSIRSNEQSGTCLQPVVVISPQSLQVAENGGTATFTVSLADVPTQAVSVGVTSANAADLAVSSGAQGPAGTITLSFPAGSAGPQTVTVTGVNGHTEGAPIVVNVTFTVTSADPNYPPASAPGPLPVTIVQDLPGILINPPSGLATVNGGSAITFAITLATIPNGNVTLNLSVSDPNLATVSPPQITNAAWNNPVTVTVTPLDANTATTYIAPYEIFVDATASTDPAYAALGIIPVPIATPTSTPPLSKTWGSCGLLGLEGFLPLGLLAVLRRRRRAA